MTMPILQCLHLQYLTNPVLKQNLMHDIPIISLINGGGIRGSISQGRITTRQIMAVFPFGNNLVVITMSGKDIKKILNRSASLLDKCGNGDNGGFLQVSGILSHKIFKKGQKIFD